MILRQGFTALPFLLYLQTDSLTLAVMPKNVTIKDIAAEAGVSIALVSFVMNNRIEADGKQKYRVNENTRQRILEVARKLNYKPNSAARTLRRGHSLVIGAILSDISNIFYGEIARHLEQIAFEHGYTVLFGSTDESPEKLDRLVRSFLDKGVDGFIVVPCEGSEKTLWHISNLGIPVVIIDRKDVDFPAPMIVLDNLQAMNSAVSLLTSKGISNIHLISYEMRISSMTGREAGFIQSMRSLGYDDLENRIHRIPFADVEAEIDKLLPKLYKSDVEGLVCANNALAIAAIRKLSSMGVKIQKDIHLVGFDNSDVYGLFYPPIPHVGQPIEQICFEAFSYLRQLINNEISQSTKVVTLEGVILNA